MSTKHLYFNSVLIRGNYGVLVYSCSNESRRILVKCIFGVRVSQKYIEDFSAMIAVTYKDLGRSFFSTGK